MHFFLTLSAGRIILALGVINLIAAVLIFGSCRNVPGLTRLLKNPNYKRLYKFHGYLWWVLWPLVATHAIMATLRFVATYFS